MKAILSVLVLCLATSVYGNVLQDQLQRNILTTIFGQIGAQFNAILDYFKEITSTLAGQFTATVLQVYAHGSNMIEICKPILLQLISDLKDHVFETATQAFQNAIHNLNQNLQQGKRDLALQKNIFTNILGFFGEQFTTLGNYISQVSSSVASQFLATLAAVYAHGSNMVEICKPILQQLIADLTSHAYETATAAFQNALHNLNLSLQAGKRDLAQRDILDTILNLFGLKELWQKIRELGGQTLSAFTAVVTHGLALGGTVWQEVLKQLKELQQHLIGAPLSDALSLITNAIHTMNFAISQGGKRELEQRDILDTILNLFGLKELWQKIRELGGQTLSAFTAVVTHGLALGGNVWQEILKQLKELQAHLLGAPLADALSLITNAIHTMNFAISQGF